MEAYCYSLYLMSETGQ